MKQCDFLEFNYIFGLESQLNTMDIGILNYKFKKGLIYFAPCNRNLFIESFSLPMLN